MFVVISDLLNPQICAKVIESIPTLPFISGKPTAGQGIRSVKDNLQIDNENPVVKDMCFKLSEVHFPPSDV